MNTNLHQKVIITGIDMDFRNMVRFLMKWVFAVIPAFMILGIIAWIIFGVLRLFSLV